MKFTSAVMQRHLVWMSESQRMFHLTDFCSFCNHSFRLVRLLVLSVQYPVCTFPQDIFLLFHAWQVCVKTCDLLVCVQGAFQDQSINQSINRTINVYINQSIDQTNKQRNNQAINQAVKQSINQSVNRCINKTMRPWPWFYRLIDFHLMHV